MLNNKYQSYALALFFLLIIYLSYTIIKPFTTAILASIIIAYIFFPAHKWLRTKINETISATLITLLILAIIIAPLIFVTDALITETKLLYKTGQIQTITDTIETISQNVELAFGIDQIIGEIVNFLKEFISGFIIKIPSMVLNILIMFFLIFFLLKDGDKIIKKAEILPIKNIHKEELIERFHAVTKSIVYGWFATAIIQGILGTIAFVMIGISNPIFWGFIMALLALLPAGAILVWLPISMWLIFSGNYILGIGLLLYGALIISTMDNFIRAYIAQKKGIHPITAILGLLGGTVVFGFIGIVIGPLILSFLLVLLKIYGVEHKHAAKS